MTIGSHPALGGRILRHSPLDLRQRRFSAAMRGFDRTEVTAYLTEVADDYEQALQEIDLLRQELLRMESFLNEHRQREDNLRNTLLTAQKLADEIRDSAQREASVILKEAENRADLLLEKAQARLEEIEREIGELRMKRRNVEGTLESTISAVQTALEFVRSQDRTDRDERVLLHRPRASDNPAAPKREPADEAERRAEPKG